MGRARKRQEVAIFVPEDGALIPPPCGAFRGGVRGGTYTALEGEWQPRTVILEFPSRQAAEAWYNSEAYQDIIGLRLNSARGSLVIVDGV
jgi:uncharacterized protein (DUF1330 family)